MKSFFTILLFLALTWFCVYWFGQENEIDRDFSKIPVVGAWSEEIFSRRLDIWDYASRGPSIISKSLNLDTEKIGESLKNSLNGDIESIQKVYQENR